MTKLDEVKDILYSKNASLVVYYSNGVIKEYYQDRVKDIINRGGEKIFPMKIETLIDIFPGVAESAVYAFRSARYGEEPAAAIIAKKGETPDLAALRAFLKERIASFEMPVRFEIRDSFPVTQNGKVRKAELRKELENSEQKKERRPVSL